MILGRQSGLGKGLGALIPRPQEESAGVSRAHLPSAAAPVDVGQERSLDVPIELIDPNPDQPRVMFDHHQLEDLISSIKEQGIIQPLTVSRLPSGRYQLIAGERRLRAAGIAGLTHVPVMVHEVNDEQRLVWSIIENVQRQDLNPMEEGRAYHRLVEDFHLTQEEVAHKMGKSRPVIANAIRLLQLPSSIQQALMEGKIGASHARTLLSLPNDDERMKLFQKMLEGNFTVRQVEDRVPHVRRVTSQDPNMLAAEDQLRETLHCKARIQHTLKGGGEIRLQYYSMEELQALLQKLLTSR